MTTASPKADQEKILAEGKTKILRPGKTPDELIVSYKDDATAGNGKKHAVVPGKGNLNAKISIILFSLLHKYGIPTCFVRPGEAPNELIYRRLTMIPLEVVIRNVALGSIVKRFKFEEGRRFEKPLLEFFYKTDDDPQITDTLIDELGLIPPQTTLDAIGRLTYEINEIFVTYFEACGIVCADFKLEFGVDDQGHLVLGDELSPDNFRLRDLKTGAILDKDVFRLDLRDLAETYTDLLTRMEKQPPEKAIPKDLRTYEAEVVVTTRKNVLNPESRTILEAVKSLGGSVLPDSHVTCNVEELNAGKRFKLKLQAHLMVEAERYLAAIADQVLSNPVIEDFSYSLKQVVK